MNMDDIIQTHEELDRQLRVALATMERKDTIANIRHQIIVNQNRCPHFSEKYNWTVAAGRCPYCGFVFDEGREY